jgi:ATP-dependent Clp protease ATP-binding subunit ClpC
MEWQVIVAIVTGICGAVAAILTVRIKWIQVKVLARKAELANTPPPDEGADDKDCIRDLTQLAREGRFDPLIGHARELYQIIQVLIRQTRNNPLLVGVTGVGKSKLVEGVADVIARGVYAPMLSECRILAIDLTRLCTKLSDRTGLEKEKRLQVVFNFKTAGSSPRQPVILLLEDLHSLLQIGVSLAPWLNHGRFQCIGTTTPEKYRECIEKDPELERYFQPVTINEPTVDETIDILRNDRDRKEAHYRIRINDDALSAAALLSQRYLKGSLPAKAIELLDETASQVQLKAVARSWPDFKDINGQIEQINLEKERAVDEQDFEKAAHLRDQADKLKKEKEPILSKWRKQSKWTDCIVDEKEICETLALTTGIPAEQLNESIHHPPPATLPGKGGKGNIVD